MSNTNINCPKCGASLNGDSLYCSYCGAALIDMRDLLKRQEELKITHQENTEAIRIKSHESRVETRKIIMLAILAFVIMLPVILLTLYALLD